MNTDLPDMLEKATSQLEAISSEVDDLQSRRVTAERRFNNLNYTKPVMDVNDRGFNAEVYEKWRNECMEAEAEASHANLLLSSIRPRYERYQKVTSLVESILRRPQAISDCEQQIEEVKARLQVLDNDKGILTGKHKDCALDLKQACAEGDIEAVAKALAKPAAIEAMISYVRFEIFIATQRQNDINRQLMREQHLLQNERAELAQLNPEV